MNAFEYVLAQVVGDTEYRMRLVEDLRTQMAPFVTESRSYTKGQLTAVTPNIAV